VIDIYNQINRGISYSEQEGNREDSFNRATKVIAFVVISNEWRFKAISTTCTTSDSVTCLHETNEG